MDKRNNSLVSKSGKREDKQYGGGMIKKNSRHDMEKKSSKQKTVEDFEVGLCPAIDYKRLMMMITFVTENIVIKKT